MTSWQSGETPCGRSAGDMSVTRPPKISIGASNEPAVVIFLYCYIVETALYLKCLSGVSGTRFWAARNRRLFLLECGSLARAFEMQAPLPSLQWLRGVPPQKRRQDRRTPYHFPAGSCSRFSACDFRLRGESFSSAATKPYCAAFSRSRIAPQERHTATPCLIFSAQTGQSASGRAS